MPTGGVNADNMQEDLTFNKVTAVGGSWMLKGTHEEMVQKIKIAVSKVKEIR